MKYSLYANVAIKKEYSVKRCNELDKEFTHYKSITGERYNTQ